MAELDALLEVVRVLAPLPLVLRGGLAMRLAVQPAERPVDDVDVLSDEPMEVARERVRGALVGVRSEEVIWAETATPGVRWQLDGGVQVDLGFGDPRPLPDVRRVYPGTDVEVTLVAPEVHWAWKVHGLFERGRGKWRPKDLWDLWLLQENARLDRSLLGECVRVAFETPGDPLVETTARFREGDWGETRGSQRKWRHHFLKRRGWAEAPDFFAVREAVREWLGAAVGAASETPTPPPEEG
ncbi:MAG: nucleotidyl transferase AbiEii/AbiGii toxin family protein [Deltaproteobacteria bacterium]|nr:nucleotidyl transferase AbiEii/AbiGii toxin family protein [Deltaproteobacteria bacterium]